MQAQSMARMQRWQKAPATASRLPRAGRGATRQGPNSRPLAAGPRMIYEPIFYLCAIPAVILVGLAKGGFGGSISMIGVPLMALAISPVAAAGIMLPILIVMDVVGLIAWRAGVGLRQAEPPHPCLVIASAAKQSSDVSVIGLLRLCSQ